jgi:hypothetical protein
MRQPLSPDQQRSVEAFVRRLKERCKLCGSEDLRCDDSAATFAGGGYSVRLICANDAAPIHVGGIGLVRDYSITADEARQIGLG